MAVSFACPCGAALTAAARHTGLLGRCPACSRNVRVPGERAPAAAPAAEPAAAAEATAVLRCAGCGELVEAAAARCCLQCRAAYHDACWREKGRCAAPDCPANPRNRALLHPGAAPEAKLRPCAVCRELIPEHAHRCRHCGEFTDAAQRQGHRRAARAPARTSYLAGFSLIGSLLSLLLVSILPAEIVALPFLLLPAAAIGLGIWGLLDIRRSGGAKRGVWAGSFGIGLSALAFLKFLIGCLS